MRRVGGSFPYELGRVTLTLKRISVPVLPATAARLTCWLSLDLSQAFLLPQPQVLNNRRLPCTGAFLVLYNLSAVSTCVSLGTMSTSITIPMRTTYGESSKAAAAVASSSSSSSYSSSPRTPQQPQTSQTSTPTSSNTRYGHDRRPSLLS
jgi:hypothetical protein